MSRSDAPQIVEIEQYSAQSIAVCGEDSRVGALRGREGRLPTPTRGLQGNPSFSNSGGIWSLRLMHPRNGADTVSCSMIPISFAAHLIPGKPEPALPPARIRVTRISASTWLRPRPAVSSSRWTASQAPDTLGGAKFAVPGKPVLRHSCRHLCYLGLQEFGWKEAVTG